jgi:hypothetical protein
LKATDAITPLHYFHEEIAECTWQYGCVTAARDAQKAAKQGHKRVRRS